MYRSKGMDELQKLFLAAMDDKKITKRMVEDLVPRNLEQNIFDIVTYVLKKDVEKAIQTYRDLLLQKEEPIKINAILLGQFRLLIQVKLLAKKGYQQPDMTKVLNFVKFMNFGTKDESSCYNRSGNLQFSTKVHFEFGILGLWKSREFDLWMKKYKKLWRNLLQNL